MISRVLALALALALALIQLACATLPETAPNRSPPSAEEVVAYQVPLETITRSTPALSTSLNSVRSYQVVCATTATPITDAQGQSAVLVWNSSATPVFIGGATVNTTTAGFPICTTAASCPYASMSLDAKYPYCRVAAGTVTIKVLAGLQ